MTSNPKYPGSIPRRRQTRSILAMSIAGLILASPGLSFAEDEEGSSHTSILIYDEKGRVIGRKRAPTGGPERAAPSFRPNSSPAEEVEHVPNEILVATDDPRVLQRAQTLGFRRIETVTLEELNLTVTRLRKPFSGSTRDSLELFRRTFPGVGADYNTLFDPSLGGSIYEAARAIGWGRLSTACGAGMRIGMIDTPVHASHAALRGRRIVRRNFVPASRQPASADHETAIAVLLVGNPKSGRFGGLVPGAKLMAASIFEMRVDGRTVGNLYSFMMALNWMARERVSVLNMSLETVENSLLSKGLDAARRRGLVLAAAAGNGGARARPAFPAAHPEVLAVTAVSVRMTAFSRANRGSYIDFSAPGVRLWTAVPGGGGRYQSGTSLAVPFVTAVAALQIAAGTDPNPGAIRKALIPRARDLGRPGKDEVFGWGLIRYKPRC